MSISITNKEGFRPTLQFALLSGVFDVGIKVGVWRHLVGGWAQIWGSVNTDVWKRLGPSVVASFLTCWTAVPLEIARKAYIADKKFPEHLRRNYRSVANALFRIPFEEGPSYLFKNGQPTMLHNFILTGVTLSTFDFLIDMFSIIYDNYSMAKYPFKIVSGILSVAIGTMMAYPFGKTVRDVIEMYPRQIGGETLNYDYKKAFHRVAYQTQWSQNLAGYGTHMLSHGPGLFAVLFIAESLGMFKSWRTDFTRWPGINAVSDIYA